MVEVYKNIFVGDRNDYYHHENDDELSYCLCAKTFHKEIAILDGNDFEGYSGNMDKLESEYLIAERLTRNTLAVNLIDVEDSAYISPEIIDKCLWFISHETKKSDNQKVLIACDKGQSRSVGIAFIYGIVNGLFDDCQTYEEAFRDFKELYPNSEMKKGIQEHTTNYWEERFYGKE